MLKQKYFLTDFFILSAEKQPIKLSWRNIEWLRYIVAPLLLLALFLTYQVSITLFTHVHIVNGVMIVHSHPSSEKHHTHTTGQVILIAHLSTIQTLEPGGQTEMTVFRPVLYVLE